MDGEKRLEHQNLGGAALGPVLFQLRDSRSQHLAPLVQRLDHPHSLCQADDLQAVAEIKLDRSHPLFASLVKTIEAIDAFKGKLNTAEDKQLRVVKESYEEFIMGVCEVSGNNRLQLLAGQVFLFGARCVWAERTLVIEEAQELTTEGLRSIGLTFPKVRLSVNECCKIDSKAWPLIFTELGRARIFFRIGDQDWSVSEKDIQETLWAALYANKKHFAYACLQCGASLDEEGTLHRIAAEAGIHAISVFITTHNRPDRRDKRGQTALHCAAAAGKHDNVGWLCDLNAKVDLSDSRGYTPLLVGVRRGHSAVVAELLGRKADAEYVSKEGENILHIACLRGHTEVLNVCRKYIPEVVFAKLLNAPDREGNTPLHMALMNEAKTNLVKLLLDWGADPNAVTNENRGSFRPVHRAAHQGHVESCRLLQNSGGEVTVLNGNLDTPLDAALDRGHKGVVDLFMGNGEAVKLLLCSEEQRRMGNWTAARWFTRQALRVVDNPQMRLRLAAAFGKYLFKACRVHDLDKEGNRAGLALLRSHLVDFHELPISPCADFLQDQFAQVLHGLTLSAGLKLQDCLKEIQALEEAQWLTVQDAGTLGGIWKTLNATEPGSDTKLYACFLPLHRLAARLVDGSDERPLKLTSYESDELRATARAERGTGNHGPWQEALEARLRQLQELAQVEAKPETLAAIAHTHRLLAHSYALLGILEEANTHFEAAFLYFNDHEATLAKADFLTDYGIYLMKLDGKKIYARRVLKEALEIYKSLTDWESSRQRLAIRRALGE